MGEAIDFGIELGVTLVVTEFVTFVLSSVAAFVGCAVTSEGWPRAVFGFARSEGEIEIGSGRLLFI